MDLQTSVEQSLADIESDVARLFLRAEQHFRRKDYQTLKRSLDEIIKRLEEMAGLRSLIERVIPANEE